MVVKWRVGWCLCAWLMYASLTSVVAELSRYCTRDQKPVGVCGGRLSQVLSLVCGSRGYQVDPRVHGVAKRSKLTNLHSDGLGDDGPFMTKRQAFAYLQKRSWHNMGSDNVGQGIVCECCQNQCGFAELQEYCAIGDKSKRYPSYQQLDSVPTGLLAPSPVNSGLSSTSQTADRSPSRGEAEGSKQDSDTVTLQIGNVNRHLGSGSDTGTAMAEESGRGQQEMVFEDTLRSNMTPRRSANATPKQERFSDKQLGKLIRRLLRGDKNG